MNEIDIATMDHGRYASGEVDPECSTDPGKQAEEQVRILD
jgi:hypothetical protein